MKKRMQHVTVALLIAGALAIGGCDFISGSDGGEGPPDSGDSGDGRAAVPVSVFHHYA